jgi:hypothetical protein
MPQATGHLTLTQKPGFDPKSAHVGFVVDEVALGDDFSPGISVFPCQYHSTNDTHSFTHVSPPLHNMRVVLKLMSNHFLQISGCN